MWVCGCSVKPRAASSKRRKMNGRAVDVVNGRIGTRIEHYLAYISNVMHVLDRTDMKRYHFGDG
jgi:hypothetical protein